MKDDVNCGACGNVCGGTCIYGRCLVTLASGQSWPSALAVDDAQVYWSNGFQDDAGNISSVPIDGGAATILLQATVAENLVVNADSIYMTLLVNSPAVRASKDGGALEYLNSGNSAGCSLALDENYVYVGTTRVPLDGGPGVVMQTGYYGSCPSGNVAFDTRRQYWPTSYGGSVESLPVDGGAMFTIASGLTLPQGIAVDSTAVYWSTYGALGSIQRTALGGGGIIETLATNLLYPFALIIDGPYLYFTLSESPDGAIMRMPTSGGTPTVLADKQGLPVHLVVDATSVYWTNPEYGTVMKLTPK